MKGMEYQKEAMRTNDGKASYRLREAQEHKRNLDLGGIINACLGLSGEVGELNDLIKKWIFHEREVDMEHLKKECGDILWYVAMLCHSLQWDMDEIMKMNIDKLKARYPEGFDTIKANDREEKDL
ncbi:nucleotide pyrophosphohydrolase [bacterium 1XD42-8]|jgi:NTP pyrophosphatase (non-canonical NTP hydrolase)|nr:nucleoside triphosphate pyrophosphohydrolase family protein [Lachnospiraceae bacterium]RKJ47779.1 nucleotide pyrophosphohydrolase [bacterium 1XD42-8]